jgi:hypothetical protein
MNVPELLDFVASPPSLQHLLIGAYAVGLHGHTRTTFDLDILARKSNRSEWTKKVVAAGLNIYAENENFTQFSQTAGEAFDIMFVNEGTFEMLWTASVERDLFSKPVRIPSLDHLLALKLHALKSQPPHRTSKDAEDVEMLARRNGLDLTQKQYEELFLKFGTREIYETILRILKY